MKHLSTLALRNALLVLGDMDTTFMGEHEYNAHKAQRAAIRAELQVRTMRKEGNLSSPLLARRRRAAGFGK